MQELPGAPGTARQGRARSIIVSTNDGGVATQPRAPGHERPLTAQRAARHGRLSAASTAPGADVPRATPARVPGQYCLSAAPRAPGHGRPLAITAGAPCRDRLSAALRAPADDAAPAITATAPRHHRPCAAPIATVSSPAGLHRLRQECLPRVPANPRTLIYPHSHHTTEKNRATHSQAHTDLLSHHTIHQVHPAIQVPPYPRSCSTAATGFPRQHPSRAPPTTAEQPVSPNKRIA